MHILQSNEASKYIPFTIFLFFTLLFFCPLSAPFIEFCYFSVWLDFASRYCTLIFPPLPFVACCDRWRYFLAEPCVAAHSTVQVQAKTGKLHVCLCVYTLMWVYKCIQRIRSKALFPFDPSDKPQAHYQSESHNTIPPTLKRIELKKAIILRANKQYE